MATWWGGTQGCLLDQCVPTTLFSSPPFSDPPLSECRDSLARYVVACLSCAWEGLNSVSEGNIGFEGRFQSYKYSSCPMSEKSGPRESWGNNSSKAHRLSWLLSDTENKTCLTTTPHLSHSNLSGCLDP